jgi:hypothetical protein
VYWVEAAYWLSEIWEREREEEIWHASAKCMARPALFLAKRKLDKKFAQQVMLDAQCVAGASLLHG